MDEALQSLIFNVTLYAAVFLIDDNSFSKALI